MTSITAQQTKLDLELVPKENHLDIGKCNGRIPHGFSPREPSFQVTLDALALTPSYPAFLITADVPEGRDFDPLPSEEDTVSFLRDLGHTGVINSLNDVVVDQMHQPWRTFADLINKSLSGKTTGLDKLRLSRAQIIWGIVQGEGTNAEMTESQQGNENLETTQEQVVEDAHVTISTVTKKTEVPVTSSSRSSDLASKFLIFLDIPHTDAEIVSPLDVPVHHEVPRTQAPTLLSIPVSVIPESSPVFTNFPQSSHTFTPTTILATPIPLPTIQMTNPLSNLPDFLSVLRFNDRISALEKEVAELKKDPLHTQRGRKDKDKDEDPSSGSDRGLQRRKTSKDAEPTTDPKNKDSTSSTSKGTKSQPRPSGKSVQSEEPVFEVADSDMPQDQEGDIGDNEDEPRKGTTSRSDWFKKPTPVQEPTDPDWHIGKTTQEGPPQKWLMTPAASAPTDKSLKDFDELMSTPIDFSAFIMNGLNISNLTQETLLGPAFRLLKGTRKNYAELEYDFEECYKALSEKLDWENPKGGDYPFDLSKPLPLITHGKRQKVPFKFFINNDLKYLQGGISTMTYMMSTTKTKAAQYDLPGIEDMVLNIWSPVKRILAVTHVSIMRKYGYEYLEEIVVQRADNALYRFKEVDFPQLQINDIEDMLLLVVHNRLNNLSGDDVANFAIALRMYTRSLVIQKRVEDL
ncbi:hypothetical protein Tco_1555357 [Tanacetum coccineum]